MNVTETHDHEQTSTGPDPVTTEMVSGLSPAQI